MNFFIKNPKLIKKNLAGGRGGGVGVTRVNDFCFQENPSVKKKKNVFFLLFFFMRG